MKRIYITICILSVLFLFATACQADAGLLSLTEILSRSAQALLALLYAISGLYRWERRAEELRRRAARRAALHAAYCAPIVWDWDKGEPVSQRSTLSTPHSAA